MFRRRAPGSTAGSGPEPAGAAAPVTPAQPVGELARIAARFGLQPPDPAAGPSLAEAIVHADELWTAPRPGEIQRGVGAMFGGCPPVSLTGIRLWPVFGGSQREPDLILADALNRAHVVVDVAPTASAAPPAWVAAADVARCPRMPGSHQLWRHWQPELGARVPHDWTPACEGHTHLARSDLHGHQVSAIPQHDAWVMSRSWLPREVTMPSADDVRWIVLTASDQPLRERQPLIRSRWDSVSFARFATVVTEPYDDDASLSPSLAAVLRLMLPPSAGGDPGSGAR